MTAATQAAAAMNHHRAQQQQENSTDDGFVPAKTNSGKSSKQQQQKKQNTQNGGMRHGGRGRGRGGRGRGNDPFKKKGWTKPTSVKEEKKTNDVSPTQGPPLPHQDDLSQQIASLVTSEFHDKTSLDEQINTAIASTAAVSLLDSMTGEAAAVEESKRDSPKETTSPSEPTTDFRSMMKASNMANLMADFGEQDKEWKKKEIDDTDNNKGSVTQSTNKSKPTFPSRLAPHGKAPIHISIESFGYIHGAVSNNHDGSWSPYSQPLPPLQCSDNLTEPIPNYLLFHDGLRSGHIKRLLREQAVTVGDDDDNDTTNKNNYRNLQEYARKYVAKQWIFPKLVEAQTEGQHGYANPVNMTISIGSHLGRHRSVVIVEWAAAEVRALLRKNAGNAIACPVSVGTFHRDVDKKVPAHATDRKDKKRDDDDDNDRI